MRYLGGFLCVCALGVVPLVGCSEGGGEGGSGGSAGTGGDGGSGGSAGTGGTGGVVRDCTGDDFFTECMSGGVEGLCVFGECGVPGFDCSAVGDETFCLVAGEKAPGVGLCSGGDCLPACRVVEEGAACHRPEYPWEIGICAGGSCEAPCEIDADCTDYNDCTADTCLSNGLCESVALQDGSPCGGGTCDAGECALQGSVLPCTEQGIRNAIAAGGGPYTFDCQGPTPVVAEAEIVIDNDVILDGEGNLMVDGDDVNYVMFSVPEGVAAELRGFTVTNAGLGIDNDGTLTLTNSTVSGNSGGIQNYGTLTLADSTVSENRTSNGLAGIQNYGTLTLTNSTVSNNTGYWGGIYNFSTGTVTLTNSTVSGNTANGVGGGGILSRGTVTLTNSTVSGNTAGRGGGILNGGTLTLTNTLFDNDCAGTIDVSGGGNLESPGNTCGFDQQTDQVNVSADDLKLGPLQDNGGPTMTHALGAGSVAIDQIPAVDCEVTEDQRGVARPQGPACDVGAFELEVAP